MTATAETLRDFRAPRGRPLRIAVVGNCQAGGIADALNILDDDVHAMPFMVHTIAQEKREAAFRNLAKYDLVLSQPIKSFGVLNTDNIRPLGKPVLTFPNVYFRGLHPDICFLGPGTERIRTPLANNNSLIILLAFLQGLSVEDCVARFTPETYTAYGYDTAWEESRAVLERREADLDLKISHVFADPAEAPRMYVMNHPTMPLLSRIAAGALDLIGRRPAPVRADIMPDRLRSGTIWPLYMEEGRPVPPERLRFKGAGDRYMTLPEFIAASYAVYEKTPREKLQVSSPDELAAVQARVMAEGTPA